MDYLPLAVYPEEDIGGGDGAGSASAHEVLIQGDPGNGVGQVQLIVGDDELIVGWPVEDPTPTIFDRFPASQYRPSRMYTDHVGAVTPETCHHLKISTLVGGVERLIRGHDGGTILLLSHPFNLPQLIRR